MAHSGAAQEAAPPARVPGAVAATARRAAWRAAPGVRTRLHTHEHASGCRSRKAPEQLATRCCTGKPGHSSRVQAQVTAGYGSCAGHMLAGTQARAHVRHGCEAS